MVDVPNGHSPPQSLIQVGAGIDVALFSDSTLKLKGAGDNQAESQFLNRVLDMPIAAELYGMDCMCEYQSNWPENRKQKKGFTGKRRLPSPRRILQTR